MLTFNVVLGYQGLLFRDFLWFFWVFFFFQSDWLTQYQETHSTVNEEKKGMALDIDWTVLRYIFFGDCNIRMSHDNNVTIILVYNRISAFICVFSGNPLLYIYF